MPAPLPSLPPELLPLICRHLVTARDLCALSQVSSPFNHELTAAHADPLWRRVWLHLARLPPDALLWARVAGPWRQQVAASFHLARLPRALQDPPPPARPAVLFVPPRYTADGSVRPDDRVRTSPRNIDVEDVLGRAVAVVALGRGVVVGFEKGIAFLKRNAPQKAAATPRGKFARLRSIERATLFYENQPQLGGVLMFSHQPQGDNGIIVAAMSTDVLVRIDVEQDNPKAKRPLKWTIIDSFGMENAAVVEVTTSEDGMYALVGFASGRVRVVHIAQGGCRRVLAMRESAEMIVANGRWLLAANSFLPIACGVWEIEDGRPAHDFTCTSIGWEEITSIAGLSATRVAYLFAIWNGHNAIRILNAKTGDFCRIIRVDSTFLKCPRSATEEAEHGAVSPHVGRRKMIMSADRRTAVVATSNRAFVVPLSPAAARPQEMRQLDGAKRALLALSTDDRVLVTAESNVFGSLGSRVLGRASLASEPLLRFWDVASGRLQGDIVTPSTVTSVSTAGDIVAAVAGAVGQVMVAFSTPQ